MYATDFETMSQMARHWMDTTGYAPNVQADALRKLADEIHKEPKMDDQTHKPLPVLGYTSQSDEKVELVNKFKASEERLLRFLEDVAGKEGTDLHSIQKAHIRLREAFMWINRAIFNPQRIKLPEDE